jgi:hypothetical protein
MNMSWSERNRSARAALSSQDRYTRDKKPVHLKTVVLENDICALSSCRSTADASTR